MTGPFDGSAIYRLAAADARIDCGGDTVEIAVRQFYTPLSPNSARELAAALMCAAEWVERRKS